MAAIKFRAATEEVALFLGIKFHPAFRILTAICQAVPRNQHSMGTRLIQEGPRTFALPQRSAPMTPFLCKAFTIASLQHADDRAWLYECTSRTQEFKPCVVDIWTCVIMLLCLHIDAEQQPAPSFPLTAIQQVCLHVSFGSAYREVRPELLHQLDRL